MKTPSELYPWFERLAPIVGLSASPNGAYLAVVRKIRCLEMAEYKAKLIISNAVSGVSIRETEAATIRQPQFSMDSQVIGYVQHSIASDETALVLEDVDSGRRQTIPWEHEVVETCWAADGMLMITAEAPRNCTGFRVGSAADLLPWMRQHYAIYLVRRHEENWRAEMVFNCGELSDVRNLCARGNELYFTSTACPDGKHLITQIHKLGPGELHPVTLLSAPTDNVFGLAPSPDGRRLCFHAPRVFDGGTVLSPGKIPRNYYDTRVHVYNLAGGTVRTLQAREPMASSVQAGLYPPSQDIHWKDGQTVRYVCRQGADTCICEANIDDDAYRLDRISAGSSFLHEFTQENGLYCAASDSGLPFSVRKAHFTGGKCSTEDVLSDPTIANFPFRGASKIELNGSCESWLYLPQWPKADVPVVVCVYGGPFTTPLGFDDTHQLLISSGVGVLVLNPPGCSGYGDGVADTLVNDWGERAWQGIVQATRECLEKCAVIRRTGLGICGASYGGFLALRTVNECDLFNTAVAIAPITDIPAYWGGSKCGFIFGASTLCENFPYDNPNFFVERSPIFKCKRITCPVLLLHGEFDDNVPAGQSAQMFLSLKLQNKEVEYIVFSNEGHGLRSTPKAAYCYGRLVSAWFSSKLNGANAAWTDALCEINRA